MTMATDTLEAPVIEEKPPVTEPGKTPLSEAWKGALKAQEDAAKEPALKEAAVKTEKPAVEPVEKKDVKKPSALDAVLDPASVKPVDEKPVVVDELPANAPAKQLREAMERHKAEAIKWKTEAEKAKTGDPATKQQLTQFQQDREKLTEENKKLRDAIAALDVKYDPDFQEKYVEGRSKLMDKATGRVKEYGGDPEMFKDALQLSGKRRTEALREALENVDDLDKPRILSVLEQVQTLDDESEEILKDSQKSYANLTKTQQERALKASEETIKAKNDISQKVISGLPTKHPFFNEAPEGSEGAEDYNTRLKSDMDKAAHLRGPESNWEEVSEASAKAARYDFLEQTHLEYRKNSQAEIAGLKEELEKYQSAEPGFTGRLKTDKTSNLDKTPAQIYRETLDKLKKRAE